MDTGTEAVGYRKQTNVFSLLCCIGFILTLLFLIGYCYINGDISRITMGYDECGNICGKKNERTLTECGSNNKRRASILNINERRCVSSCDLKLFGNRCYSNLENEYEFAYLLIDLQNSLQTFAISTIITLMFSFVLYSLYRYATPYVVNGFYTFAIILLAGVLVMTFLRAYLMKFEKAPTDSSPFLLAGSVSAVVIIILLFYIIKLRKRIPLVIQLLKEASIALCDTPMLIAEPILTVITFILTCTAFTFAAIVIEGSGRLTNHSSSRIVDYEKDFGMILARYLNIIAFIWFSHFILGCQHFVVAGTVSQWYFTRTKSKLIQPIKRSFSNLLHFHLGSICLGSILITVTTILRTIMSAVSNWLTHSKSLVLRLIGILIRFLAIQLERFMKYLVQNAYIIVAKDGTAFFDSGRKAVDLLTNNLIDVIALNTIAHFVLFLGKAIILTIVGFLTYELLASNPRIQDPFVVTMVFLVLLYLIVQIFMSVYDMTLNTIFICFCEDCEVNDGITRPYFMSPEMLDVMKQLQSYIMLEILKQIAHDVESNIESSIE